MARFIISFVIVGIAVAGFFVFTRPLYQNVFALRAEVESYNQALSNSKALENERDKLTAKFNAISKNDLDKLNKLLPDNIDNIRLILEVGKLAAPYEMVLKDVKFNATDSVKNTGTGTGAASGVGTEAVTQKDFRILNMEFSVAGNYNNFLNFTKDLENNLRIIDISSVAFSSESDIKANPLGTYKYNFRVKTYWLKN